MLRTILVLIATLVALPLVAFYFDAPLSGAQTSTVKDLFTGMLLLGLACFAVSELSRNYSQVDKIWSLAPIAYAWFVALESDWNQRLVLMAFLVTLWGLRLTYNFARRGGYHWLFWKGDEDYRWAILRQQAPLNRPLAWSAFNLFFISLYQNTLILLFTLPAIVAWQGANKPLGLWDGLLATCFLLLLLLETLADQQQWDFQREKYRRIEADEPMTGDYAQGFLSSGLWGKVRHPNYAAEQAIWLVFYAFSVAATGRWINWSLAGVLLLMLLFLGSSDFSEKISAKKYPGYAGYQQRVPRFWPWGFPRKK
jgi:steroid 5-alpha reductase family enzyme